MPGLPASVRLGRFIARRREDLGIDQVTFGRQTAWSEKTVRLIERGRRALKSDGEVVTVARALKLEEDELRDAAGEPTNGSRPTLTEVLAEVRAVRSEVADLRDFVEATAPPVDATFDAVERTLEPAAAEDRPPAPVEQPAAAHGGGGRPPRA